MQQAELAQYSQDITNVSKVANISVEVFEIGTSRRCN